MSAKLARLAEADPGNWTRSATIIALRPDRSAAVSKVKAPEQSVVGVALLCLDPHMCRWPMAYSTEQTFCGDERARPSSYCGDHEARSRLPRSGRA